MSRIDDILKEEDVKCREILKASESKMEEEISEQVRQYKANVYDNIPLQFGKFLDEALGDKINSVRSSVLNHRYFQSEKGKPFVENANKEGLSIEDYIKKDTKEINRNYWSNRSSICLYLSTGKKFGVSYFTSETQRIHTMYFDHSQFFHYLSKGHVDLIKNRRKRECAGAFLEYRDDIISKLKGEKDAVVDVSIPYKKATILEGNFSNKYDRYAYRNRNEAYMMLGDIVDDKIQYILVDVPEYDCWDGISNVDSTCKSRSRGIQSYVSLTFFKVKPSQNGGTRKELYQIANFDVSVDESCHTLKQIEDNSRLINHANGVNSYYNLSHAKPITEAFGDVNSIEPNGVPINLDEVVRHPDIKNIINEKLKVYGDISQGLRDLKEEFSDLYFINSESI